MARSLRSISFALTVWFLFLFVVALSLVLLIVVTYYSGKNKRHSQMIDLAMNDKEEHTRLYWEAVALAVSKPAIDCNLLVKFGRDENPGHSTYHLCFDDSYRLDPVNCLVYSFGIAFDFSFDDHLANYGCDVFSFDPGMNVSNYRRDSGVYFLKIGLASEDANIAKPYSQYNKNPKWEVKRLSSIMKLLKQEERRIDVLKIDIEGSEASSLIAADVDGILSGQVACLTLEWHTCGASSSYLRDMISLYGRLLGPLGFRKYYNEYKKENWNNHPEFQCMYVIDGFLNTNLF